MRKAALIVIIGIITLLGGCKSQDGKGQAHDITLGAEKKEQIIEAYGIIKAQDIRDVVIDFPASVEQISVKNGQKVQMGDTLMVLKIEEIKTQIKEMEYEISLMKEQTDAAGNQADKIDLLEDKLALLNAKLERENVKQELIISDCENGLVYNLEYVKGDMVFSGSRLLSIANLESVMVNANIDQQFIGWVETGSVVDIIPEYDKNSIYKGKVSFISLKAFQNNGETTIPVEITMDKAEEGIILDADVQVKIYPVIK